jgi:hypothetical protein
MNGKITIALTVIALLIVCFGWIFLHRNDYRAVCFPGHMLDGQCIKMKFEPIR